MVKICFLMLIFVFASISIIAQEANLRTVSAQMSDGIRIEVSLSHYRSESARGLFVKFKVHNESTSDIYLITETPPKIHLERSVIEVGTPLPSSSGHGRENLSFTKIKVGSAHQGIISIPVDVFDKRTFSFLTVGMAYIREFDELSTAKSETELVGILRNNAFMRSETVRLGFLSFDND